MQIGTTCEMIARTFLCSAPNGYHAVANDGPVCGVIKHTEPFVSEAFHHRIQLVYGDAHLQVVFLSCIVCTLR